MRVTVGSWAWLEEVAEMKCLLVALMAYFLRYEDSGWVATSFRGE